MACITRSSKIRQQLLNVQWSQLLQWHLHPVQQTDTNTEAHTVIHSNRLSTVDCWPNVDREGMPAVTLVDVAVLRKVDEWTLVLWRCQTSWTSNPTIAATAKTLAEVWRLMTDHRRSATLTQPQTHLAHLREYAEHNIQQSGRRLGPGDGQRTCPGTSPSRVSAARSAASSAHRTGTMPAARRWPSPLRGCDCRACGWSRIDIRDRSASRPWDVRRPAGVTDSWHTSGVHLYTAMYIHTAKQSAIDADGWRFGVSVMRWSRSTQLLYIKPG